MSFLPASQIHSLVALLSTLLLLSTGCRSRTPGSSSALSSAPSCSQFNLAPEDLFRGAKPGVAVVRTNSMEGSAFVVRHTTDSTYLLTNSHVVGNSSRVGLRWSDGREDAGDVIANAGGKVPQADLALIQVKGVLGQALMLKTTPPSVGADVVAIGSPQGLDFSLTRGVVSSLRENSQLLQVDAPINPGNSGGPILDKSGCVVGVATFKLDDSEGLNFAVSSSVIDGFIRDSLSSPLTAAQSTPSSAAPPPGSFPGTPGGSSVRPSQSGAANCWFQASPGSSQLSGFRCQISAGPSSQGRAVVELIDPSGKKRVIYLRSNQIAEVYVNGQRFDGQWMEDQDGDLRVDVAQEIFAFKPPS